MYTASFNDMGQPLLLAKYSSAGTLLFKKTGDLIRAGAYAENVVWSSDTDAQGEICVVGSFQGITISGQTYNSFTGSDSDCFLIKYHADGSLDWVRRGGGESNDFGLATAVNKSDGSVYVGGVFLSTSAAFDLTVLKNAGPAGSPFIAKYTKAGDLVWAIRPDFAGLSEILSLSVGPDGSVFFTGISATGVGGDEAVNYNLFVGKCAANGAIQWVKPAGQCSQGVYPHAIPLVKAHPAGDLYLAFMFRGTVNLGGGSYTSAGNNDILLARLNPDGTFAWAKTAGFIGDDRVTALWVDEQGQVFLTGTIANIALFDDKRVEGNYSRSIFIAKLQNAASSFPSIVAPPDSQTALNGEAVTFRVAATSPTPATYQWYFNDTPISGATSASYTIPSVTAANEGYYFVEVTNAAGTVRSASAQLVIQGQVPVLVTTVAGTNSFGYVDSADGSKARFYKPNGIAYFSQGLMVVGDGWNHLIRLLDPSGSVGTYAGVNALGYLDGPASTAKFNYPLSLTVEKSLNVLVTDFDGDRIRRIDAFGLRNVSTVAGSGVRGYKDGDALQAQFNSPNDLAVDANGNIFVSEYRNHTVRKITPDGKVSTFAGNGAAGWQDGMGTAAQFNQPGGMTIDAAGNLYVTEWSGQRVRKITPQGLVSTIAGTNKTGFVDGQGSAALFNTLDGITVDSLGNLYVTEVYNHAIRKIDPSGNVTTVAGLGTPGFKDGDKGTALFYSPGGIMWHPSGSLYVSDTENHAIRRIDFVTTQPPSEEAELLISLNPTLTIFGKAGAKYRIEGAEAGSTPLDWTILDTITLTNGVEMWADTQPATRKKRYYRAVKVQ